AALAPGGPLPPAADGRAPFLRDGRAMRRVAGGPGGAAEIRLSVQDSRGLVDLNRAGEGVLLAALEGVMPREGAEVAAALVAWRRPFATQVNRMWMTDNRPFSAVADAAALPGIAPHHLAVLERYTTTDGLSGAPDAALAPEALRRALVAADAVDPPDPEARPAALTEPAVLTLEAEARHRSGARAVIRWVVEVDPGRVPVVTRRTAGAARTAVSARGR
ncbi:MAG: hypothetical protein AAFV86_20540, partial [Pseudomonadota bacterium]